jgi:hypothetical protein
MRRFVMVRQVDVSGISGTGVVIWGIEFPDGRAAYRWNTATATTCIADTVEDVYKIHGHEGATRLVWVDSEAAYTTWERWVGVGDTAKKHWRGAGAASGEGA